jgi:hypothetical protein
LIEDLWVDSLASAEAGLVVVVVSSSSSVGLMVEPDQ